MCLSTLTHKLLSKLYYDGDEMHMNMLMVGLQDTTDCKPEPLLNSTKKEQPPLKT